ncbi:unnamed protein product [Symbiodinium microadriaticum]|nr:unnamed protein product [Symbiodinium microadriaticum]
MACPDPPTLPEGYGREDLFGSSESQWRCDDGWVGQVNRTCLHFSNCSFQVLFDGCRRKLPCMPLTVSDGESCKMDLTPCEAVEPGLSCDVTCRAPYKGGSTMATCAPDNIDPMRELEFTAPICQAECDPYPPGYMRTAAGWGCAPGYNGLARADRADCGEVLQLSGCLPLQPCLPAQDHPCLLDTSDCVSVFAGGSCVVRCPEGVYEPDSAVAICPEGNTDPMQPLIYVAQMNRVPLSCRSLDEP